MSAPWRASSWLPASSLSSMDCSTYSMEVCNSFSALSTIVSQIHHSSLGSPSSLDNKENEDTQTQDKKRIIYVDETGCNSVVSGDSFSAESDLTPVQINTDYSVQVMSEEYSFCDTPQIPSTAVLSCINDACVDTKKSSFQQTYENSGEASSKDSSMPKLERIDHCNMPASNLKQRKKYAKELSNSPVMPILEKQTYAEIDVALKCKTRGKRVKYCPQGTTRAMQSKCFIPPKKRSDVKSLRKRYCNNTSLGSSASEKDKQCNVKKFNSRITCKRNEISSLPFLKNVVDNKIGKECVLVERLDLSTIKSFVPMKEKKCLFTVGRTKVATKFVNYRKCKNLQRNGQSHGEQSDICEETVSRNKRKKTAVSGNSMSKCSIKPLSQKPQPCNFCNSEQSQHCLPKYARNVEITVMKKKQRKASQKVKKQSLFRPERKSVVRNSKESCRVNNYSFRTLRSSSKPINSNTVSSQSCDNILNSIHVRDQTSLSNRKVKKSYRLQHTALNVTVTNKLHCRTSSSNKKQSYLTVKENFEGKLSDNARELLKMCKNLSIQLHKLKHIPESTVDSQSVTSNYKNISCGSVKSVNASSQKPQVKRETDINASHLKNICIENKKPLLIPNVVLTKIKHKEESVSVNCNRVTEEVSIHSDVQLDAVKFSTDTQPVLAASEDVCDNSGETSIIVPQMHTECETKCDAKLPDVVKSPIVPEEMETVIKVPVEQKDVFNEPCSSDSVPNSDATVSCDIVDPGCHVNETSEQSQAHDQLGWYVDSSSTDVMNSGNCDVTEVPDKNVVHFNNSAMNNFSMREETLNINTSRVLSNEASWDLPLTGYKACARTEVVVHPSYSVNHSNQKSLDSHTSCVPAPWKSTQHASENSAVCFPKDNFNPSTPEFSDCLQQVQTCNLMSLSQSDTYVTSYGAALFNYMPNRFSGYAHQNYVNIDPYFEYVGSAYNMHSLCLQDGTSASNRALNWDAKRSLVGSEFFNRDFGNNTVVSPINTSSHPSHEDQPPYSQMEEQDLYSLEFDHLFGDIIMPATADDDNRENAADFASNTLTANTVGNVDTGPSLNIFEGIDDGLLYRSAIESTDESLNIQETFLEGEESARLSEIISYLKEPSL